MYVDDKTMNVFGKRTDGTIRDELIVRVYADEMPTSFILYEDDGETMDYQNGLVMETGISQEKVGNTLTVTINSATGTYKAGPPSRHNIVELEFENQEGTS